MLGSPNENNKLGIIELPELFMEIFKFLPVNALFNLVNTCTTLHSALVFPALCYVIESNHNYVPIFVEDELLEKAREINENASRFDRKNPFLICPSTMLSENGKFYAINFAEFVKRPFGGCYFEKWSVTTNLVIHIGLNGSSAIFVEGENGLSTTKTVIKNYLLDVPCYHKIACVDEGEGTEEMMERLMQCGRRAIVVQDVESGEGEGTEEMVRRSYHRDNRGLVSGEGYDGIDGSTETEETYAELCFSRPTFGRQHTSWLDGTGDYESVSTEEQIEWLRKASGRNNGDSGRER